MTQVALARASGAFGLGTAGTRLAGGACLLLLMSTTALPFLILYSGRARVNYSLQQKSRVVSFLPRGSRPFDPARASKVTNAAAQVCVPRTAA